MNKRPFLFGLGVGIIVGAALLQLMLIGEKQTSSLDDFDKGTKTAVTYTQADLDKRSCRRAGTHSNRCLQRSGVAQRGSKAKYSCTK